jgi:hypothetical protein
MTPRIPRGSKDINRGPGDCVVAHAMYQIGDHRDIVNSLRGTTVDVQRK